MTFRNKLGTFPFLLLLGVNGPSIYYERPRNCLVRSPFQGLLPPLFIGSFMGNDGLVLCCKASQGFQLQPYACLPETKTH